MAVSLGTVQSSLVLMTSVALDASVVAESSFALDSPEVAVLEILSTITFGRFRSGSA